MKRVSLAFLLALVLFGCQTVPTEIPEDLTQAELIQLAQESADSEAWDAAIAYYRALQDRFPQDRAAVASAVYEVAFIEYKRGNLGEAKAGFEQVVGMYDFEAGALPRWPKVLAEKLLTAIAEQSNESTTTES